MTLSGAAAFEGIVLPHLDAAHNLARWLVQGNRVKDYVTNR